MSAPNMSAIAFRAARSLRALAALCLVTAGLSLASPAVRAEGEIAPPIELRDINNQAVSLTDFKGKVVFVNFWATWCGPCQVEMPHLQAMHTELAAKGFTVLSVSIDDARSSSMVKPLIKRNNFTFPVVLDKETKVVSVYNPAKTLPYSVIIDRDGRIVKRHAGYTPGDEVAMRKEVEALLGDGF